MRPYLDVLGALTAAKVRYVVVGGVAVALHGHLRATVDLDIVIDLVPENARKAIDALTALGLRPRLPVAARNFADDEIRRSWVMERNLMVFSMCHPENPAMEVDLFAAPPIAPAELLAAAEPMPLGDIEVLVASRAHLIRMKELAGRAQDIADIEALREEPDA
ncbi:hypothetical protein [Mycobacterium lacus]|uniref:hypothetical protein n=1 Tax=Mycobacterium lacus TaxID=169765 RepID=UPI000A14A388|nr:hypothetical protein [Mycobacterium lacus]MCV7122255.1 hypothetical protein [Mycobacterium lacus]ORW06125.1 hypothetical protein AWC15_01330 [Mycobacterium lacus]